jgi:hypothetical protein
MARYNNSIPQPTSAEEKGRREGVCGSLDHVYVLRHLVGKIFWKKFWGPLSRPIRGNKRRLLAKPITWMYGKS